MDKNEFIARAAEFITTTDMDDDQLSQVLARVTQETDLTSVALPDTYWDEFMDTADYPIVLISGQGRSGVGQALRGIADSYGFRVITEQEWDGVERIEYAVCLYGYMAVDYTERIKSEELDQTILANYYRARAFSEQMIAYWREENMPGYLVIVGSIAGKYGNTGAVDYAAMKAAIGKYAELRGREVRANGIRISVVNFGGIDTGFWRNTKHWPQDVAKSVCPDPVKALTADEAAQYLVSLLILPERVTVKDSTVVSVDYQ